MKSQFEIDGILIEVIRKSIKNIHLSVHPPYGRVTISAPVHLKLDTIRVFAIAKLSWIRDQQKKILGQEREAPREFLNRESHFVWGERYLMKIIEVDKSPSLEIKNKQIVFRVRPEWGQADKQAFLDSWYRALIKESAVDLLPKWEKKLGVEVGKLFVQRMKTKWGSCNSKTASIRLNSDLAKKPKECLEYIIVHEMAHILVPTHNKKFIGIMDQNMPKWRSHQQLLNSLPVKHENWEY
ncbi:M48 family metallopeptidase [Polynucleobacter sp. MWH-HuK1]|uniref:M48 family metallopeptidase n=1 Tax=Polynucleobacter sp. MWH-HuK1 TaxID=1743158 RepID=UPI001C0C1576|nr:SprT family zinc-dependent metalloprotease [Polynucleobacter sp. MWH-HuK1]MBU3566378.1 M48 family metallopeptidase [Polynucleobacter sp. MWH-HuK1]